MKSSIPQGYTIKDVFEIIESTTESGEILRNRIKAMRSFSTLGPADICHLSKKYQSGSILSMNKEQIKLGTYHYIHGMNLSTPASVSAYINQMIKNMEDEKQSLFQRGEWKVVKGYFCIFDAFSRIDIHIEITIPGTMKLYGFTIDNELVTITDQLWERAMVSSGLRSMYQQDVPAGKYFQEFQTQESLKEYLRAFNNVVKEVDLPYENMDEMEKHFEYRGSKALYLLTEYLIKKRMFSVALNYMLENISENPKVILHLNHLYICMKQYPDGIKLLANYMISQPESPQLLYQQAKSLYTLGKYEDAYRLANFLVGVLSTSFDAWFLLSEIFYKMENFEYCLVALNQASEYAKTTLNPGHFPDVSIQNSMVCESSKASKVLTQPKDWGTISTFNSIYVVSQHSPQLLKSKVNYSEAERQKIIIQSQEQFDTLMKLTSMSLSEDEYKIYQLLIDMEKKLGWENMMRLRGNIFMLNQENFSQVYDKSNDFPYNILNQNNPLINQINNANQFGAQIQASKSHPSQESQNSYKASNKGDELTTANSMVSSVQNQQQMQEFPPEYDGTEFSDGEEELPQFLKDDTDDSKQKNYGMANIKDPQIQKNIQRKLHLISQKQQKAQNNPKFEKNNHITELTEDSMESERVDNLNMSTKLQIGTLSNSSHINIALSKQKKKHSTQKPSINDLLPYPNKRLIHKVLNHIFQSLYDDLNYLIRWQTEDKNREDISSNYERMRLTKQNTQDYKNIEQQLQAIELTPEVWLLRSQLAMRMKFYPLAEKGLKEVLKKNFCFYCYNSLIHIAEEKDDPKKMIYVIAELLDEMELFGVKQITALPSWIEDYLLGLISKKGLRIFKSYLNELQFDDKAINDVIKKANYFQTDGTLDQPSSTQQKSTPHLNAIDAFNRDQQGGELNKIKKTVSIYN